MESNKRPILNRDKTLGLCDVCKQGQVQLVLEKKPHSVSVDKTQYMRWECVNCGMVIETSFIPDNKTEVSE